MINEQAEPFDPWNTCPECEQNVDVDDCFDGSEVSCLACDADLVCVSYVDGSWELLSADDAEDLSDE